MMDLLVTILRYIAPSAAIIILLTCIISLFRNRPRVHTLAKIVDQNDGSIIELKHWETSVGKSKANDIVLPFPAVAKFHAVISKKRKTWVITDTSGRATGILVNGKKIEDQCEIENGDEIQIGNSPFKFICDEAVTSRRKKQLRKEVKDQGKALGVLVDIKTKKPKYIKKNDVIIGRDSDCDIRIDSKTVSGHHARMKLTSKGWALVDLDSHNGTKINGRIIYTPQLIYDEDMITFSDSVFIFYDK